MSKEKSGTEPGPEKVTEQTPEAHGETVPPSSATNNKTKLFDRIKPLWRKYYAKKKITIPLSVLALIAIMMAVPLTRYALLGLGFDQELEITVSDTITGKPVSDAEIKVAGKTARTDAEGYAKLSAVKVGYTTMHITKQYYESASQQILVPLSEKAVVSFSMVAKGRQVPVKVINKITGKGLKGATIKALDTETTTDESGESFIVLPVDNQEENASISLDGFNTTESKIKVTGEAVPENTFAVTPSGKIYFLSKRSGNVDVVKTNLDGSERETVLAGTGHEEEFGTVLLAARDWKYLALKSRREGERAKLYLLNTDTDKLTVMDEGDADFTPVGWYNQFFMYSVRRRNVPEWENNLYSIKSYDADSDTLTVLDDSRGEKGQYHSDFNKTYRRESLQLPYIQDNYLVYAKVWSASEYWNWAAELSGKQTVIVSVRPDGSNRKTLKAVDASSVNFLNARLYEPKEVYFAIHTHDNKTSYYEVENNEIKTADVTSQEFNKAYPTFLISPSGESTFWYESRDGKNALLKGNSDGDDEEVVASLSEYVPYGWYSDDYLLLSKNSSELFIMPADGVEAESELTKITDYHRPEGSFAGYGYGYGGL